MTRNNLLDRREEDPGEPLDRRRLLVAGLGLAVALPPPLAADAAPAARPAAHPGALPNRPGGWRASLSRARR
jgi:hypothetical protein